MAKYHVSISRELLTKTVKKLLTDNANEKLGDSALVGIFYGRGDFYYFVFDDPKNTGEPWIGAEGSMGEAIF